MNLGVYSLFKKNQYPILIAKIGFFEKKVKKKIK